MPCLIAVNGDCGELSLAENVVRIAMHPADQVIAFYRLAESGVTISAIAARFGISERLVEQRLRLGRAAPELLDAYWAEEIDLETLKVFAVTTDHGRQRAVWAQVKDQGCRPGAWQVRRMLTEDRVPGTAAIARFVGIDAYEAAGGAITRDLFAQEDDRGIWFDDPALLNKLAMQKLQDTADELDTRWKWAEAAPELDWSATARFGRIRPEPAEPTDEERAELQRLSARHDEFADMDDEDWTGELVEEAEGHREASRRDPRGRGSASHLPARGHGHGRVHRDHRPGRHAPGHPGPGQARGHAREGRQGRRRTGSRHWGQRRSRAWPRRWPRDLGPIASPPDPRVKAREEAGVGIGLADDLRAIRTALVKAHLAKDYEAAFDLMLFQLARAVFTNVHRAGALDVAVKETADRPTSRMNDEAFANWSPGEAMLADRSGLSLDWMEHEDEGESFAALRALPEGRSRPCSQPRWRARSRASSPSSLTPGPSWKTPSPGSTSTSRSACARQRTCCGRAFARTGSSPWRARPWALPGPRRGRSTRRPTSPRRWKGLSRPETRPSDSPPLPEPPLSPGLRPASRPSTRAAWRSRTGTSRRLANRNRIPAPIPDTMEAVDDDIPDTVGGDASEASGPGVPADKDPGPETAYGGPSIDVSQENVLTPHGPTAVTAATGWTSPSSCAGPEPSPHSHPSCAPPVPSRRDAFRFGRFHGDRPHERHFRQGVRALARPHPGEDP